jgi:molybdopterin biosynthesis enzyme
MTEGEAKEQAWQLAPHAVNDYSFRVEPASRGALAVLARNPFNEATGFSLAGVEVLDGFWIRERIQYGADAEKIAPIAPVAMPSRRPLVKNRVIELARLRLEAAALEYALAANDTSHGALLSAAIAWGAAVRSEAKAELKTSKSWTVPPPATEGGKS